MPHHRDAIIQLENLDQLSRAELRTLWTEELAESPPASLGRDILALGIDEPVGADSRYRIHTHCSSPQRGHV